MEKSASSPNLNNKFEINHSEIEKDLENIDRQILDFVQLLAKKHIFITGGTGFIGCWLLESLRFINQLHNLDIQATILTRNASAFRRKAPHLFESSCFHFVEGDICSFATLPGEFTHIIHAATEASSDLNAQYPTRMFDTIVLGTRRILEFAVEKKVEKFLFLSSGAVYGKQPWDVERVAENWPGAPNCLDPLSCYAEGKRAAEMLCILFLKQFDVQVTIARIFALLGPYLSLDIHFAAGNFMRDALAGKPIVVNGNGLPCRSYLYASDLIVWLLHLLVQGRGGIAYNVGSDESVSIAELAQKIALLIGNGEWHVHGAKDTGWNPGRYVPDITLIQQELGVAQTISLDEAILRTARWYGWKGRNQL